MKEMNWKNLCKMKIYFLFNLLIILYLRLDTKIQAIDKFLYFSIFLVRTFISNLIKLLYGNLFFEVGHSISFDFYSDSEIIQFFFKFFFSNYENRETLNTKNKNSNVLGINFFSDFLEFPAWDS